MATITTKFSIGDVVYAAGTTTVRKQRPCPDCLGTRKWKAVSPAGQEYEFGCPRCATRYLSNNDLSLDYSAHAPNVERLTIGQVRTETGPDAKVQYMCRETGIGSGTLWSEDRLYATDAEATEASDTLAKVRDEETGWIKKQFDKTLEISDYELTNATVKTARDCEISRSVRFQMLVEDLSDCQTNEEVQDALERYRGRVKELEAA